MSLFKLGFRIAINWRLPQASCFLKFPTVVCWVWAGVWIPLTLLHRSSGDFFLTLCSGIGELHTAGPRLGLRFQQDPGSHVWA